MKGLSNPEEVVRLRIPDSLLECLSEKSSELERETAAIISFPNNGEIVEISGGISRVTKAAMNIEHEINMFIEAQALAGTEPDSNKADNDESVGLSLNSVDHNLHASKDGEIYTNVLASQFCFHDQENPNLINPESDPTYDKSPSCTCNNNNNNNNNLDTKENINSDSNSNSDLMEYGLKLGYSEDEVKGAMKKLGNETAVNKNELLHELIKASTSAKQIGKTEDFKTDNCSGYPRPLDASILRHIVIDGSNIAMRYGCFVYLRFMGLICPQNFPTV